MPHVGPFEIDEKTYFTLHHAAQVIGPAISDGSLHRWASRGHTPWDLELDIKRQPVLRHGTRNPRVHRETRLVISEESTLMLKRLLNECRPNPQRPMRLTNDEIAALRAAERRLRLNR